MASILLRLGLLAGLLLGPLAALAQAPPPVPALPDTERRTSYVISGTTCACAVGFQLYGDSTDYANWIEVFINGVLAPQNAVGVGWTLSSPTGPFATIPRPINNAILTFNAVQTGTIQIVGARRPRRAVQFTENRGVAARDLNLAITDLVAQNREVWDKINDVTGRAILGEPGDVFKLLPPVAARAGLVLSFDNNGSPTLIPVISSGGNVTGTLPSTNGGIARWIGTTGVLLSNGSQGVGYTDFPNTVTYGDIAQPTGPGIGLPSAGQPFIISGQAVSPATDSNGGILYVSKDTHYATPAQLLGVQPAIFGNNTVHDGVWSNTVGTMGSIYNFNTQHSQPLSTASAVAVYGTAWCEVAGCSATWGGVFSFFDISGQVNPQVGGTGLEVDHYSHGADTGNNSRVGILLSVGSPDSGTSATITHGLLFTTTGNGATGGGLYGNLIDVGSGTRAINGIAFNTAVFSGNAILTPGFAIDNAGNVTAKNLIINGGGVTNEIFLFPSGSGNFIATSSGTMTNGIVLNGTTFTNFAIIGSNFSVDANGNELAHSQQLQPIHTAALPACTAGLAGTIYFIDDNATAPSYHGAIGAGGGANHSNVVCNAVSWVFD